MYFIGMFVSFLILVLTVLSVIIYYELFIENKNELTEEHATKLQDFKVKQPIYLSFNPFVFLFSRK